MLRLRPLGRVKRFFTHLVVTHNDEAYFDADKCVTSLEDGAKFVAVALLVKGVTF